MLLDEMISRMKMSIMSSLPVIRLLRSSPTFWLAPSRTAWPSTGPVSLYVSFHNINSAVLTLDWMSFCKINCRHLWLWLPWHDNGRNVTRRALGPLSLNMGALQRTRSYQGDTGTGSGSRQGFIRSLAAHCLRPEPVCKHFLSIRRAQQLGFIFRFHYM